ncbi:hypothetical protein GCM10023153_09920 [Ornithinibacter aureus]|uniref:Uncharacterized protein n=1 Tax=Ornithinibacter aureus TaxID=622664 RepID=A0ABP8JJ85_9MICO|nr:hypothetical protein C8E84_1591 [Ornithinibacter aureus]
MGSVRTSILGRPRRLPRYRRAAQPYTLNCEEPHNPRNLVQIPTQVHQKCLNSWMARKGVREFGVAASSSQTMRQWVGQQSYSVQHRIGVDLLRRCGVNI